MLRHLLRDTEVLAQKVLLLLFCGLTQGGVDPLLQRHVAALYQQPEVPLKNRKLLVNSFHVSLGQQQHLRVFERIDVHRAGLLGQQAVHIRNPPAFRRNL